MKQAILAVSFGTSYPEAEQSCILPVEAAIAKAFPSHDVRRAYSSRIIMRKLRECGEAIESEAEALERLRRENKLSEDLSSDKDLAQFELLYGQAKETVNKMHGILLKVKRRDEDAAGRLGKTLRALAEAVGRCAE